MPRANSSVPRHRRHRKIVKLAKGYYGRRKSNFRAAKDAVEKVCSIVIEIAGIKKELCVLYGLLELMLQ